VTNQAQSVTNRAVGVRSVGLEVLPVTSRSYTSRPKGGSMSVLRAQMVAAAAAAVVLLAGCGGSGTRGAADAPVTADPVTTEPSQGAVTLEPTDEPTDEPAEQATDGPEALESDPAVQAVRGYFRAAYRAIEDDDLGSAELAAASTPQRARANPEGFADVVHLSAPGPLPLAPTAVRTESDTERVVAMCAYWDGWLREPGGEPEETSVRAGEVVVQQVDGTWKVHDVRQVNGDCSGVQIQEETW